MLPCNAYGLILSTNLTNLHSRTLLINIKGETLKTHLVLFVSLETIFITTADKISLMHLAMLTILFSIHHGLMNFLWVGSCSKTSPTIKTDSKMSCAIIVCKTLGPVFFSNCEASASEGGGGGGFTAGEIRAMPFLVLIWGLWWWRAARVICR